ncbi:Zn(II)2Cys6 transcription factor, partial [Aspergillus ibericus CBS 121593]
APRRRRASNKRSKTGCRTCRIRRIKCDETPGRCFNCQTSGWPCEGVELHPLPGKHTGAPDPRLSPSVAVEFQWTMTSDEKRCLSFFRQVLLSDCIRTGSDPTLWEQVIFPLSAREPAVYHAVLAFSAVNHHIHEAGRLAIPGQTLRGPWHGFALIHSSRAYRLLQQRTGSQDPQLPPVLLVCCLLFILRELACARYDDANVHLQSGLRILHELRRGDGSPSEMDPKQYPIPPGLLEAFLYLDAHSAFHGVQQPFLPLDQHFHYHASFEARLSSSTPFHSVRQARQTLHSLVPTVFLLLEHCWSLADVDRLSEYPVLQPQQYRLLSCLNRFGVHWTMFLQKASPGVQDHCSSTMVQLSHRTFTLAIKTCLHPPCHPDLQPLHSEYKALLSESLHALATLDSVDEKTGRPHCVARFTPDGTLCAALSFLALRCPDYAIRARAIQALRAAPRGEGYYNGVLVAEFATSGLKLE